MLDEPTSQRRPIDRPQEEINGITPLCLAAYLGKDVIVNALLKDGSASVDARDKNGATALMYAARDGHVQVVEALLFHGALPDATDDNGWTAIQYGQMYRHIVRSFEGNLR
ncbi:MAG: ankyrin repeat-containing domain protein, partial [Olpidium bornovanus]